MLQAPTSSTDRTRTTPETSGFAEVARVEEALATLDDTLSAHRLLASVSEDATVREASGSCNERVAALRVEATSAPSLYRHASQAEAQARTPVERALARRYRELGAASGASLDAASRRALAADLAALETVQNDYMQALFGDRRTVALSDDEARGVPADVLASYERVDGGYRVVVGLPTQEQFMRHVGARAARERYLDAYYRIGGEANARRVREALALRAVIARRLGFADWASYRLSTAMAGEPSRVDTFLREIAGALRSKAQSELQTLVAQKRARGDATPFGAADFLFEQNALEQARYAVEHAEIRRYFPVEHVVPKIIEWYERLLGVRLVPHAEAAWADTVARYRVDDADDGRALGWLYIDIAPRPGKVMRPASYGIRAGRRGNEGTRLPVAAIIGSGPSGTPALFSHRDVVEFFHEFGHVMHMALSSAPYASLQGTSVRADFSEAPSQMLENWMWDRDVLKHISKHVDTGAPLPDAIIDRLLGLKHMNVGIFWTRQAFLAAYDLALHTGDSTHDPDATWFALEPQWTPWRAAAGTQPSASFLPIMGGYDAGYYGYLWSRVYAQDLFSAFETAGLDDAETGRRYRRCILEPGASQEPDALARCFLGRDVGDAAFRRELGVSEPRR